MTERVTISTDPDDSTPTWVPGEREHAGDGRAAGARAESDALVAGTLIDVIQDGTVSAQFFLAGGAATADVRKTAARSGAARS